MSWVVQQGEEKPRERGCDQIEFDKAPGAPDLLNLAPEPVKEKHVEQDVHQAVGVVEERIGDELPEEAACENICGRQPEKLDERHTARARSARGMP